MQMTTHPDERRRAAGHRPRRGPDRVRRARLRRYVHRGHRPAAPGSPSRISSASSGRRRSSTSPPSPAASARRSSSSSGRPRGSAARRRCTRSAPPTWSSSRRTASGCGRRCSRTLRPPTTRTSAPSSARGFGDLVAYVRRVSGRRRPAIWQFFSTGMLLNVLASMGVTDRPEPWMRELLDGLRQGALALYFDRKEVMTHKLSKRRHDLDARDHLGRALHGQPRQPRRHDRAAGDPARAARDDLAARVDGERVHAHLRRAAPHRRGARRPLRPAAALRPRPRCSSPAPPRSPRSRPRRTRSTSRAPCRASAARSSRRSR